MEGKWELQLPSFCAPLACTDLLVERKWATSGGGERSDKFCVTADVPLSLKSDMWKRFLVKKREGEKATDGPKTNKIQIRLHSHQIWPAGLCGGHAAGGGVWCNSYNNTYCDETYSRCAGV